MPRLVTPVRAPPASKSASKPAAPRPQPRRLRPSQQAALWEVLQLKAAEKELRATEQAEAVPEAPSRGSLPARLRTGIEQLSGLAMDDVRVHRDSPEPAGLGALAFARGSDIHLGPGQEAHLPHEAWHVVQQKRGRVRPTMRMKGGGAVNDEAGLEREATIMGGRALQAVGSRASGSSDLTPEQASRSGFPRAAIDAGQVAQLKVYADYGAEHAKKHYGEQIAATGTASVLDSFEHSKSESSGVFYSDETDWFEQFRIGTDKDVIRVVLPYMDFFKAHPEKLPTVLRDNGLSVEQNCKLVAEHELIHLRQATENMRHKSEGAPPGAQTASDYFSDQNIKATVNELMSLTENVEKVSGLTVQRYERKAEFLRARIPYILTTWEKYGKNSEAPAVMRELRRYLEIEDLPASFKPVYDQIKLLDEDCKKSLYLEPPKKSFWSIFGF